jgi:hypothetical protein
MLPALLKGIPAGHDLPNHLRLALPFYDGLSASSPYPGWYGEANHGFGDTVIRFYPPGLYYLLSATRAITGNWYAAFILGFVLLSVLGGFGAFFWARQLLPTNLAVWAGILYVFVPYRVNEFYGASLLAEYAAASVLPFAFAFTLRLCKVSSTLDVAALAASLALLVLTNLPLAVIGSLSLLFYAVLSIERARFRQSIFGLGSAVTLGLAASAVYWVTMIAELSWVRNKELVPDEALRSYFDYRRNFIFSPFSLGNTNSRLSNLLALATLSLLLSPLLMLFWRGWKLQRDLNRLYVLLGLSLLMATDLSRPIWAVIPKLSEVQFPWRWLAVSSIAASLAGAASIPFCKERLRGKLRPLLLIVLGGALTSIAYGSARIRDANYLPRFEFDVATNHIFARDALDYWLPIWVNERPKPMPNVVEAKGRAVRIDSWQAEHRSFFVDSGPAEEIRIKTFYYPHWHASAVGNPLPIHPAYDGAMLISLPADAMSVSLEFREPRRSRFAAMVTAGAWAVILLSVSLSLIRRMRQGRRRIA